MYICTYVLNYLLSDMFRYDEIFRNVFYRNIDINDCSEDAPIADVEYDRRACNPYEENSLNFPVPEKGNPSVTFRHVLSIKYLQI